MKRWGQIKGDIDYSGVAKQVFLQRHHPADEGSRTHPACLYVRTFVVMGKTLNPAKPEDIKGFKIKRA
jgi:nitrate/nitrite transport system substrate-binding protein